MTNEIDLTTGSLWKKIFLFSLPLIASNILQVLFNMSDIAVVGKFSGDIALGAVGSTTILVTLFTGFLIGIGNGVNVLIAKYIGEEDKQSIKIGVLTSLITSIIVGLIILVLGVSLARFFLNIIDTKDDLIDGATLYLRIYFLGMPALAIYNCGCGIYSASGNTKKPLIYLFSAGIINVILNLFFVVVCHMNVEGVAIASIISQYISATLIVISLAKEKSSCKLTFKDNKFNIEYCIKVLKLGIPSGFQNSIFAIANLFIQKGVNSFDSIMVEGNSAATNFDALIYDVMAAFYMACSSFIGQNFGAKKKKRVINTYFITLIYSFCFGAILGILLLLFGKEFLRIFTSSDVVIEAGLKRIRIMALSYMVSAFMDNTIAASRGLGKTIVPTIIVIIGSCIFRIAWIYTIFAYFHTIKSLYLLYIFSWSITSIFEIIYFIFVYKKTFKDYNNEENTLVTC